MAASTSTQCLLFGELAKRSVVLSFDQALGSSDGGAVLLAAANRRYGAGLIEGMAECFLDRRQATKVDHPAVAILRQRVYGLCCGYEDANDAARLRGDPLHKLLVARDPVKGLDLASQPTLCRFENAAGPRDLYHMGMTMAEAVVARHARRLGGRARRITIDMDPTDADTYGAQQLSFFNAHYDNYCYLPMLAFVSFDDEPDQYLCAAVLRPGNVGAGCGAVGMLRRLIGIVKTSFAGARILVRLDGGFAAPGVLAFLDNQPKVDYVVGMASNVVLERHAEEAMNVSRICAALTGETEHFYGETRYAARTWPHERRVVIKAEVVCHGGKEPRDNPLFVVTNLGQSPRWIYEEVYCHRGDVENRIKELKAMAIDRTSCTDFWANQLRVLLTAAAYILIQEIRLAAAMTSLARAQAWTIRERLLKIGARVVASVRRVAVNLPEAFAWKGEFRKIALVLGATSG